MIWKRWRRVEELFHQVLERPGHEREEYLARAAAGDPRLREAVAELMRADREAGSFMEWEARSSTAGRADRNPLAEREAAEPRDRAGEGGEPEGGRPAAHPRRIGPYRLLGVLGEGGMGTVYLGEQEEPIRRRVAVKLIRAGLMGRETLLRFREECSILARLQHPKIAQVFEAGTSESGQPYLVMELVQGLPITEYCDRRTLSVRGRLDLFLEVCAGVEHLHQKAVLHRDLKPSNILVVSEQGETRVKILDLGVAKALDGPRAEGPSLTGTRILGTPSYLSPEAILGPREGPGVDTRSDVYALGVLLYELLTGFLPFGGGGEALPALLREIVEAEALAPSQRLAASAPEMAFERAALRGLDPRSLRQRLKGDLDWITAKAISREPSRRYGSAALLADDVRRHLRHQPTLAGPPALWYRTRKLLRRHGTSLAAATLVLLALAGGFVARTLEAARANREAARARTEAEAAREVSRFLMQLFEVSDPGHTKGGTITARELLESGAERIEEELESQPVLQARLMSVIGRVTLELGLYDLAEPLLTRALVLRRQHSPADSEDRASSLVHLANLHTELGRYGEAEPLYKRSLEILEAIHEGDHPSLATPLDNLAQLYAIQGRSALAEPLFFRSLRIREAHLERDDPDLARTLNNLGLFYLQAGRPGEAEPLLERSLEAWEKSLGADHPEVAIVLNNLALLRMRQDRGAEAETHLRRALEIRRKALGPEHALVAASLNNLADLLVGRLEYSAAEPLYRQSLEIAEKTVGLDHSHAAYAFSGLARLYWRLGRHEEAEPLLGRALEIRKAAFVPGHPVVRQTAEQYAALLEEMGSGRRDP